GLRRSNLHQRNEHARAEPPIKGDAVTVEPVNEFDQVGRRRAGANTVADSGELAQLGVEKMRGHILDLPERGDGLRFPLLRWERPKEFDQPGFDFGEQVSGENRRHASNKPRVNKQRGLRWRRAIEWLPIGDADYAIAGTDARGRSVGFRRVDAC